MQAGEGKPGAGKLRTALREQLRAARREIIALWLGGRDRRTPWHAKAVAAAVAAYALSPIDLIPDFIPVLGYLDDLLIVPLGVVLAVRLIPAELMTEFRAEAARRLEVPASKAGMFAVVVIWITVAALLVWLFWPGGAG